MSAQSVSPRPSLVVRITQYVVVLPVVIAVLLATALSGCSGESGPGDAGSTPGDEAVRSSAGSLPTGTRRTTVRVGEIAGRLAQRDRARVRAEVGRVVDRWWRAAWLGPDYPRTRIRDPFPGFTADAARLARRDARTMSAAAISRRIGGVVPRRRTVTVDVLAPGGRPAAATARFRLGLGTWDRRLAQRIGVITVSGRLFLTPTGRSWRVFGFQVSEDRPRALLPEKRQEPVKKKAGTKKASTKKAGTKKAGTKKAGTKKAGTKRKRGRR